MNNKYDTNNFNESVENIVTAEAVQEYKQMCRSYDIGKLDTYNFQPYDELITSEDIELHEVSSEDEKEYFKQVQKFIDQ